MLQLKVPSVVGLLLIALVAGSCAFVVDPPLSASYTEMRFDWPHVHNVPSLCLALFALLVLAYLVAFRWRGGAR